MAWTTRVDDTTALLGVLPSNDCSTIPRNIESRTLIPELYFYTVQMATDPEHARARGRPLNGKWRDELIVVSVLEAVVFMAVKGIESFITAESPDDALTYVGAVAVFILSSPRFGPSPPAANRQGQVGADRAEIYTRSVLRVS